MANGNYSVLKDNIDDYIKQNGDGDITGQVLQTQLFAMINSLGAGYQFMGVAKLTPTPTDPGAPDQNVFYVAFQPGIYSNFGSQTVADGEIAILKWNGSWTKEVTGAASAAKLDELGQEVVLGWILSEAFTLSSATRNADGNVTAANVVWPDTKTGALTITRDADGNATQMVATHDGTTYTLTITRDADGNAVSSIIS